MPTTSSSLDRIERLSRGSLTAKALREEVVAEVRRVIGFDGYVFMLTDPTTRVGCSPLADVPMLPWPQLPALIRARYLTRLNRWPELLEAKVASASLLAASGRQPSRSRMWEEIQRDLGVVDVAVAPLGDRHGCWGMLELWRTDRAFTPAEVAYLGSLTPYVVTGLRAALARTFVDTPEQFLPVGPAVVVLDPDLQVHAQTAGAAAALLQLNPPDEPMTPVPAAAYNVAAALVALEQGVPVGEPWARVHLGGSRWVTVKADRMGPAEQADSRDIAVSIEPSTPAERTDLFARVHGLSARETEVLALLGNGLSTHEVAARLVLSEHTVNDHVKSVLDKTGARTRQVLMSRALGAG
ncbi:helix-turn-helix transcriptional regulator [Marmoricola sp. URHB0036]|uniref:helix-turn-helix domain-containing protein n=1 Tax=Marmoricola sp. URHB0036 TaxID=1298863 RepID=UPI0003FBE9E1|nr:helix-turn-helix transcriptional regulator [Marmoricola sp. URHB0036]